MRPFAWGFNTVLAFCALTTAAGKASAQNRPLGVRDSLPGRIVDVRASEFLFQAPDTIPAGLTTFRLTQAGMAAEKLRAGIAPGGGGFLRAEGDATYGYHMLWIFRLDEGKTHVELFRAFEGKTPRPWAKGFGGPAFSLPPRTSNASLELEPGNYVLVCLVGDAREDRSRSHILRGMMRPLVVRSRETSTARTPRPDMVARITENGSVDWSSLPTAGRQLIRVDNLAGVESEFLIGRVPAGRSNVPLGQLRQAGEFTPWGGLTDIPGRGSLLTTVDFLPGEYVITTTALQRASVLSIR